MKTQALKERVVNQKKKLAEVVQITCQSCEDRGRDTTETPRLQFTGPPNWQKGWNKGWGKYGKT